MRRAVRILVSLAVVAIAAVAIGTWIIRGPGPLESHLIDLPHVRHLRK